MKCKAQHLSSKTPFKRTFYYSAMLLCLTSIIAWGDSTHFSDNMGIPDDQPAKKPSEFNRLIQGLGTKPAPLAVQTDAPRPLTKPYPVVQSEPPLPIAQPAAPLPVAQSAAPLPVAQPAAPFPIAQSAAPLPVAQSAAPLPVAQPAAPFPIAQSAAPLPIAKQPMPLATPQPAPRPHVKLDDLPHTIPVIKQKAPQPIDEPLPSQPQLSSSKEILFSEVSEERSPLTILDANQDPQMQQWVLFASASRGAKKGIVEIVEVYGDKGPTSRGEDVKALLIQMNIQPEQLRVVQAKGENSQNGKIYLFVKEKGQ